MFHRLVCAGLALFFTIISFGPIAHADSAYSYTLEPPAPAVQAPYTAWYDNTVTATATPCIAPCAVELESLPQVTTAETFVVGLGTCAPGTVCTLAPAKTMCDRAKEARPHLAACECDVITSYELQYPADVAVFSCQSQTIQVRKVVKWRTDTKVEYVPVDRPVYTERTVFKEVKVPVDRPIIVERAGPSKSCETRDYRHVQRGLDLPAVFCGTCWISAYRAPDRVVGGVSKQCDYNNSNSSAWTKW